ncbi:carbamoyl phosphate synthase small subunit [Erysipelothrix sp. HDW6C]|uniref:carbamoyl phosphate synthase small subunit n=1 Tax=Erysipelothrix sp. HDW6C TaxID=2714930 RepID=UPI001408F08B|nr:carbamoyl phosphate synthase small subunit [Erysipelothrix sp. HDW6C]QIK69122.1 carbamoyl phosphate synthase small subunit [Erysipelothrix sp. HDW6C]
MERYLILEDGTVFTGKAFGAIQAQQGPIRIFTGAQGYQEVMTDPEMSNSLVLFTYPSIGNTGINLYDEASLTITCAGIIVREHVGKPSNWRTQMALETYMIQQGIPGIYGIDTRALTKHIREKGAMEAKLVDILDTQAFTKKAMVDVSTKSPYRIQGQGSHITVLDLGVTQSVIQSLTDRGCRVQILPFSSSAEDILATYPHGVLISNGPAIKEDLESVKLELTKLVGHTPILGLGLGAHLLAHTIPSNRTFLSQQTTNINPQIVTSNYGGLQSLDKKLLVLEQDLNTKVPLAFKYPYDSVYGYDYTETDPRTAVIMDAFIERIANTKENRYEQ